QQRAEVTLHVTTGEASPEPPAGFSSHKTRERGREIPRDEWREECACVDGVDSFRWSRAPRVPARGKRGRKGDRKWEGWLSFNAQTVQSQAADDAVCPVRGPEERIEPHAREDKSCRYYFPLNEAFSAAAHSELLAAEREFRQRDLFTWSRSVLLIGGAPRAAALSHLY
ncbi:Calcitonin related peptide type 1 receptor, partial [Dissostichus eleginoides]